MVDRTCGVSSVFLGDKPLDMAFAGGVDDLAGAAHKFLPTISPSLPTTYKDHISTFTDHILTNYQILLLPTT